MDNLKAKLISFFEWQDGFRVLPDDYTLYAAGPNNTFYELIDGEEPITLGDLCRFVEE
jgi:hypothetical protein